MSELTDLEIRQGYKLDSFGRKYKKTTAINLKIRKKPRLYGHRSGFKVGKVKKQKNILQYDNYLRSNSWRRKRKELLAKFPNCFICGRDYALQVHHLTYYRNDVSILGKETLKDLLIVCDICHEYIHKNNIAYDLKRIKIFKNSLKKLNDEN